MSRELHLLSAGAAQGVVKAVQARFCAAAGIDAVEGRFGAVGAMKEALLAGAPCDVMITTDKLVAELAQAGHLHAHTRMPLGRVRTGIAVREGDAVPDVADGAALKRALSAADAVFFPDPERATAGIHFVSVLDALGLRAGLSSRFRTFPNGATAMAALAAQTSGTPIGCTQITEILYTPGVRLVAPLPVEFELATVYSAAVATAAREPELAAQFVHWLGADESLQARRDGGFEP